MKHLAIEQELLIVVLRDSSIFQSLNNSEIKALSNFCEAWEYEKDEVLIQEGTIGSFLYLVISGSLEIMRKASTGVPVAIGVIKSGEVLGESSIFRDIERIASAKTLETTAIISFSKVKLLDYVYQNPEAGLKIFTFIIESLIDKLNSCNQDLAYEKEGELKPEELTRLGLQFPPTIDELIK